MSTNALFEGDTLAVITFSTQTSRFAVPLQHVLYIEKDTARHSELSGIDANEQAVITFQKKTVPLYDFNRLVGAKGQRDQVATLIERLEASVTEHQNTTHKSGCAFTSWLRQTAEDIPALKELIKEIEGYHCALHMRLAEASSAEERSHALERYRQHVAECKSQALGAVRPVVLFLEQHGGKLCALRLDHIEDIVNYQRDDLNEEEDTGGILQHPSGPLRVAGFLRNGDTAPTVLLDCGGLAEQPRMRA